MGVSLRDCYRKSTHSTTHQESCQDVPYLLEEVCAVQTGQIKCRTVLTGISFPPLQGLRLTDYVAMDIFWPLLHQSGIVESKPCEFSDSKRYCPKYAKVPTIMTPSLEEGRCLAQKIIPIYFPYREGIQKAFVEVKNYCHNTDLFQNDILYTDSQAIIRQLFIEKCGLDYLSKGFARI